ncbi:MAG: hypothetical protein N2746_07545, partial [Deltaproteobacteria bacterium]|nr:hypothetical protein [Deltaproteobacteria bacterium]
MVGFKKGLLILVLLVSCADDKTELVLNIYTNYSVPDEIDRVELEIFRVETELYSKEYQLSSKEEIPLRILITQQNNSEELLGIKVKGKKERNIVVETYIERSFVKNKRIEIDIYLNRDAEMDGGFEFLDRFEGGDGIYSIQDMLDNSDAVSADSVVDTSMDAYPHELPSDANCYLICGENAKCVNNECRCNSGFENCDGKWDNGCEGDILNNPLFCGGCNSNCRPLNVTKALCINGECGYSSCNIMYEDKDLQKNNGCEKFNYFPKVYGGNKDEFLEDMLITKDGNILLLATTKSCCSGNNDMWLLKLDRNGNVIWQKVIGKDRDIKGPLDITETDDGNYMIVGSTNSFNVENSAGFILKLDKNGGIKKSFIMNDVEWISFKKIDCDKDVSCLIVGSASIVGNTGSDLYELKLDKEFNIKSQRLFRVIGNEGDGIDLVKGGYSFNYIMDSKDEILSKIAVLMLNADNSVYSFREIRANNDLKITNCIQIESDGMYCSGRIKSSSNSNYDVLIFRFAYQNQGKIAWSKAFGGIDLDYGMLSKSSNVLSLYLA